MHNIQIVEYTHDYAQRVADMWNQSGDSWGGINTLKTAQMVRQEHENSHYVNVFLALEDNEVIGYCSVGEYKEEANVLYLALLNVRPDYHGKKIGRELVKRAVELTTQEKYPTLDLFTWAGNTKAVPLYKRCGYFWDANHARTHFMNFIPMLLRTEAFAEHFTVIDWYEDNKRPIEVKPDGRTEAGFAFFEYIWEKDGRSLRVEFERSQRGMRLIETEDYLIYTEIPRHQLIAGQSYPVTYQIQNHSGQPLHVQIQGRGEKNIRYTFTADVEVPDSLTLHAEFLVDEISEEQKHVRECGAVISELLINGKAVELKTGIASTFPAVFELMRSGHESYLHRENLCYLNIASKFAEDAVFTLTLADTEVAEFPVKSFQVTIPAEGKVSLPLAYCQKQAGIYTAPVQVQVRLQSGQELSYTLPLQGLLTGQTGLFGGEFASQWVIGNGHYTVTLSKETYYLQLNTIEESMEPTMLYYPKVGEPFSSEFATRKPDGVRWYVEEDRMVLEITYRPEQFPQVELVRYAKLAANGLLEHYYEVRNLADEETPDEIWLNETIDHTWYRVTLPYRGQWIQTRDSFSEGVRNWNSADVTENWLFADNGSTTKGLCWDPSYSIKFDRWLVFFEYSVGRVPGSSTIRTKPVYVTLNTYSDWHQFRNFALGQPQETSQPTTPDLAVEFNDGNPFVAGDLKVQIREYKNERFQGAVALTTGSGSFEDTVIEFEENEEKCVEKTLPWQPTGGLEVLKQEFALHAVDFTRQSVLFPLTGKPITHEIRTEKGLQVYVADNGVLQIKAAPDFGPAIYSLQYNGHEWFNHTFPVVGPRSWFNPYYGGVLFIPADMTFQAISEESWTVEFATLTDQLGNCWSGIKVVVKIEKAEKYRGLEMHHYQLMLPGVPVLCNVVEIVPNTGAFKPDFVCDGTWFMKPGEEINASWLEFENRDGAMIRYKAGRVGYDIEVTTPILYGSADREDRVLLYSPCKEMRRIGLINKHDITLWTMEQMELVHGKQAFSTPTFAIFTQEYLTAEMLKTLEKVKF